VAHNCSASGQDIVKRPVLQRHCDSVLHADVSQQHQISCAERVDFIGNIHCCATWIQLMFRTRFCKMSVFCFHDGQSMWTQHPQFVYIMICNWLPTDVQSSPVRVTVGARWNADTSLVRFLLVVLVKTLRLEGGSYAPSFFAILRTLLRLTSSTAAIGRYQCCVMPFKWYFMPVVLWWWQDHSSGYK